MCNPIAAVVGYRMRAQHDWDAVFAWMVRERKGATAAAKHFDIPRGSVLPAVAREKEIPGWGRLAGHTTDEAVRRAATTPRWVPPPAAEGEGVPAATYVPIPHLRPWGKNPRKNDAAAEDVAVSLIRFGFGNPILARRATGEVIAGHTRLKACALLPQRWADTPMAERGKWHAEAVALATTPPIVPVRFLDLDEGEAHALALADNRTGELAGWDDEALATVLRELSANHIPIGGLGWDDQVLADIVAPEPPPGEDWAGPLTGLPSGDRQPFQQMTFTLHDDQAIKVREALSASKGMGDFAGPNENSNGNALARVCEAFMRAHVDGR